MSIKKRDITILRLGISAFHKKYNPLHCVITKCDGFFSVLKSSHPYIFSFMAKKDRQNKFCVIRWLNVKTILNKSLFSHRKI